MKQKIKQLVSRLFLVAPLEFVDAGSKMLFIVLLAIGVYVLMFRGGQNDLLPLISCKLSSYLENSRPAHTGLLSCSNVNQKILETSPAIKISESDQSGWKVIELDSHSIYGFIKVEVDKDRSDFIYFPRTSNKNDRVIVYEGTGVSNKLVSEFMNSSSSWSPVGLQRVIFSDCLNPSFAYYSTKVQFFIQLYGKAQLWSKNGMVLF
jgi:hypothetical protein